MRAIVLATLLAACSTEEKKEATEAAYADRERRLEIIESTLRVLDEHPEYVDDYYQRMLRHPRTRERFLANFAAGVADRDLAERVGAHLARNPRGLRQVMIATVDAAKDDPDAREAIASALRDRASALDDLLKALIVD